MNYSQKRTGGILAGQNASAIPLEKNYYLYLEKYYSNLRKIGLDYQNLDYSKSLDFLLMTAQGVETE